jgi:hypothetical protein
MTHDNGTRREHHDGDITRGMNSYYGEFEPNVTAPVAQKTKWGIHGTRYDEQCARCRRETEIDNNTELCRNCGK